MRWRWWYGLVGAAIGTTAAVLPRSVGIPLAIAALVIITAATVRRDVEAKRRRR